MRMSFAPVPLLSLLLLEMELKYKGSRLRWDSSRDRLIDSGGLMSLTVLSENCKVGLLKKENNSTVTYTLYTVTWLTKSPKKVSSKML